MNPTPRLFEGLREETLDSTRPGSAVLDYGSGSGMMSVRFLARGYRVTAMDVAPASEANIAMKCDAGMLARFDFVAVDPLVDLLEHDPLGTRRFALVVCREVLEHVANPWKLLAFFSRHLERGGIAVISFPNPAMETWLERRDPDWLRKSAHCRIIDPEGFRTRSALSGFALRSEYGSGAEWSILWAILAPFRFPHTMGYPTGALAPFAFWLARRCAALRRFPRLLLALNRRIPKSLVFELEKVGAATSNVGERRTRPTVLLVYDYRDWILYQWAQQIRRSWKHRFDFVSLSMFHAAADPQLKRRLVAAADVVHLLLPHATEVFRDSIDERFVGTVHHWVDYATVESTVNAMARIVTGAEQWRKCLIDRGVAPSRITVIHSGAPDEFFIDGPRAGSGRLRIRVGFSAKADSNERDRKGTRHFASLAKYCAQSAYAGKVEFVITGPGWDAIVGELRSAGAAVDYQPRVDPADMPAFMRGLDVYLMLSDVEGGPATVAEAMAAGCVVIATRIGLARDFIQDGRTGFFVENSHTQGIFAILKDLIDHPDRMRTVGNAAAQFADVSLRYSTTLAPLGQLYREVADTAAGLRSASLDDDALVRHEEHTRAMAPSAWKA